jgi:hypothetical protein
MSYRQRQRLQGPKIGEQQPRRNNEIREAVVYGIISRNIPFVVFLLAINPETRIREVYVL